MGTALYLGHNSEEGEGVGGGKGGTPEFYEGSYPGAGG